MRGKDGRDVAPAAGTGITPAYAGKSDFVAVHKFILKDHTRLCGEKLQAYFNMSSSSGSPPPMRGKASRNHVDPAVT